MGRRRKKLPIFEDVLITDAGAEGKAIARVDDAVVFVTGVVPGDVVNLQVTKKRKKYFEAKPIEFKSYSKDRVNAFCEHFGSCGGCKWQELPYEKQLFYKHKQVQDNFQRLGKFEFPEVLPILGSEQTEQYRNKMEFTFSHAEWLTFDQLNSDVVKQPALGLHVPGRFDGIINIKNCHLQGGISNDVRNKLRAFCIDNNLSFFNMRAQEGLMRNVVIRTASTGENMVIVIFFEDDKTSIEKVMNYLKTEFPSITSLMYIINQKKNDSFTDQEVICFHGRDHIYEEMEGLKFKIDPKSFYQTNSQQAYELYKVSREYANIQAEDVVYDLYTGTGTIANFVAKDAKKVIGIEYVPEAIEDAKINSSQNGIKNTTFYAGDMKDILTNEFISAHGQPSVIITDPPRAGMHEDVINVILNALPKRIVYVSCNPATQARDIQLLAHQYSVKAVQPVDMFPHTHHVENVVLLERN